MIEWLCGILNDNGLYLCYDCKVIFIGKINLYIVGF